MTKQKPPTEGRRWALFAKESIPDVSDPSRTYLTRWRLVQTPWFAIYLHAIRQPDADRHLHDHPFSFVSIVLRGGYTELRPVTDGLWKGGKRFVERGVGTIAYRRAEDAHRIAWLHREPTWTLLLVGRRRREWGFHTEHGWMHHREYLDSVFALPPDVRREYAEAVRP